MPRYLRAGCQSLTHSTARSWLIACVFGFVALNCRVRVLPDFEDKKVWSPGSGPSIR